MARGSSKSLPQGGATGAFSSRGFTADVDLAHPADHDRRMHAAHTKCARRLRRLPATSGRHAVRAALVALSMLSTAVTADAAQADWNACMGNSCITVVKRGGYVSTVTPKVKLVYGTAFRGHSETWGPGFHFDTPDIDFFNWLSPYAEPLVLPTQVPYRLYRNFPRGSLICSRFWRKNHFNTYNSMGIACIRI